MQLEVHTTRTTAGTLVNKYTISKKHYNQILNLTNNVLHSNVSETPVSILKKLEDSSFPEGSGVTLECELSKHNVDVKWTKVKTPKLCFS